MEKERFVPPPRDPEERDDVRVSAPRCPFCHEDISVRDGIKTGCPSCMAWHHSECWESHGGCSACGLEFLKLVPAPRAPGEKACAFEPCELACRFHAPGTLLLDRRKYCLGHALVLGKKESVAAVGVGVVLMGLAVIAAVTFQLEGLWFALSLAGFAVFALASGVRGFKGLARLRKDESPD